MRYYMILFVVFLFSCSPDSPAIDAIAVDVYDDVFFEDGDVETVFENDSENGINVIFMGDAYLELDLGKKYGKYRKQAMDNINALFDEPPFSSYKKHFNAYIVYAKSNSNIIMTDYGQQSNTAFGGVLFSDLSPSILTITDYENVDYYVSKITNSDRTSKELILMSVNDVGRGSAVILGNLAVFGGGDTGVMLHEVGHAFGGLLDEYYFEDNDVAYYGDTNGIPNLDATNDLSVVKWNHFIGLENYESVSAYEGGDHVPIGVWRPEAYSIMGDNLTTPFNAPSREAIVK